MAQTIIVTAEAGMEFFDTQVVGMETSHQSVGGKNVETGILTLKQSDGSTIGLIMTKNLDISIRYGEFMKYAKKIRLYKKGSSKVGVDAEGNITGQIDAFAPESEPAAAIRV